MQREVRHKIDSDYIVAFHTKVCHQLLHMLGFEKFELMCFLTVALIKAVFADSWCPEIAPIQHADVNISDLSPYKEGTTVTVICDKGYKGYGKEKIKCLNTGQWSDSFPYCAAQECRRVPSKLEQGRNCRKSCTSHKDCKGLFKKCECDDFCGRSCFNPAADCPHLTPPDNGYILGNKYSYGYTVSYGCNEGFTLNGPATRKCRSDKTWSRNEPKCLNFNICGISGANNRIQMGKIVAGNDATEAAWPWQARLLKNDNHAVSQIYYPNKGLAGGSIIDSKWILTAAHVFDHFNRSIEWKNMFLVAVGMTSYPKDNQEIPNHIHIFEPHQVYRHNNYNREIFDYDIALIRIGKRLKRSDGKFVVDSNAPDRVLQFSRHIRPVCLPCMKNDPLDEATDILKHFDEKKCNQLDKSANYVIHPGDKVMVTGFGNKERQSPDMSNKLQEGLLTIQDDKTCDEVIRSQTPNEKAQYTHSMICAKSANESLNTDSCQGDSGGPLVKQFHSNKHLSYWTLVGIVSWGFGCGEYIPGYYTSVPILMSWIWKTISSSGDFTAWSLWSSCSRPCGGGTRRRNRSCSTEDQCDFFHLHKEQTEDCNTMQCSSIKVCKDIYSHCSKIERSCRTSETARILCKKTCQVCVEEKRISKWTAWTNWGMCSKTCGQGEQIRRRTCSNLNQCDGHSVQAKECNIVATCEGWSKWSSWGACVGECGGVRTKTRTCSAPHQCSGNSEKREKCNLNIACDDNTNWSKCSRTCGDGTRKRYVCKRGDCAWNFQPCNEGPCTDALCSSNPLLSYKYGVRHECCHSAYISAEENCGQITNQKWPWLAFFYLVNTNGIHGTGVLINKKFVLAEGVSLGRYRELRVGVGKAEVSNGIITPEVDIAIRKVFIHPNFNKPLADIGLAELQHDVTFSSSIQPVCLPQGEEASHDSMCVVAGYGPSSKTRSFHLQELSVLNYNPLVCVETSEQRSEKSITTFLKQGKGYMCAGNLADVVDNCWIAYGGIPLMCQRCKTCSWYVAGLSMYIPKCASHDALPHIYTKVVYYEDWILKTTGMNAYSFSCSNT